ncbi:MAG: excinuclease ABC subunit UvrB, partial [Candidatus Omnitrophica bacterium]|nr:excinuclease ABC subunit UvrB [Candidatus Omnitrophota bacterium]
HNKTLAAQLYSEFREFFPENAVEYFVSYYDYYQPEAYIPQTDTYIEKDASINERLDRLRLAATSSLISRRDVIIVASVSCIYNLGSPEDYTEALVCLKKNQEIERDDLLKELIKIQYERSDADFKRGTFRVRGEVVDIYPSYKEEAVRVEFFGSLIESIKQLHPVTLKEEVVLDEISLYPAKHFMVKDASIKNAVGGIKKELIARVREFKNEGKLIEAERLKNRTNYDMEMMLETGYCHGIENYSRHLSGRPKGSRPWCLIDYFQSDFFTIIDESHVTLPQIRGMYRGDRSRKEVLVEHGFRLPSCLDNRPLKFDEFEPLLNQTLFVSATPADFELSKSAPIEQVVRPTGLIDPMITVKPSRGQIDDIISEVKARAKKKERVLVTTLTKRMAEDLSDHLGQLDLRVKYLHSEIKTIERVKILRDLRLKKFDCLVGVNLLREGLDLPEVSLVCILDADKEGFLRSHTSLIQVAGRCARHINAEVFMYADRVTVSMKRMIDETERRRKIQLAYNTAHNIKPVSIMKVIKEGIEAYDEARDIAGCVVAESLDEELKIEVISELEKDMLEAAKNLQFEKAAKLRDEIKVLRCGK